MKAIDFLGLRVTQAEIEPAAGSGVESELAAATYFKAIALATAISYKANALAMCLFASTRTARRSTMTSGIA